MGRQEGREDTRLKEAESSTPRCLVSPQNEAPTSHKQQATSNSELREPSAEY